MNVLAEKSNMIESKILVRGYCWLEILVKKYEFDRESLRMERKYIAHERPTEKIVNLLLEVRSVFQQKAYTELKSSE